MADWNITQTWINAYRWKGLRPQKKDIPGGLEDGAGYGEILSYLDGRKYALQLSSDEYPGLSNFRFRLQKIVASGTFSPASETIIIGCGFGWLIEVILDAGSNAVWGTDTSTVIQNLLDDSAIGIRSDVRPLILNVDVVAPDAAAQFKSLRAGTNQGKFRNIVTEHLLEDWPISDIDTILDACDALRAPGTSNVFHIVYSEDRFPPGSRDSEFTPNQLLLSEWALLRPSHYWIDEAGGSILGGGV